MQAGIGTLQESSLHASLKLWYSQPGDLVETYVDGCIVDLVRGNLCIEIQTRELRSLKKKLSTLLVNHAVRIVFPVPIERHIIRIDINNDRVISRRKSPKKGSYLDIFSELVFITRFVKIKGISIEVVLIREEQVIVNDGKGSWRRKGWSISDRRLIKIVDSRLFSIPEDYLSLMPPGLVTPFTVHDLAREIAYPRSFARKMAYSLREIGVIEIIGKKSRSFLYKIK